jgi:hypothetical protein
MATASITKKTRSVSIQHIVLSVIGSAITLGFWLAVFAGNKPDGSGWLALAIASMAFPSWLFYSVRNLVAPEKSGLHAKLAANGPTAIDEINAVMSGQVPAETIGSTRVSDLWIVRSEGEDIDAMRTSEVIWIYSVELKHRVNGLPVHTSHAVRIHVAKGGRFDIKVARDQRDLVLSFLANRCPNSLVGFDERLEKLLAKNRAEVTGQIQELVANGTRRIEDLVAV